MSSPKISVLITLFNRENYIQSCVESILNSTFRDYEVIIVDDCSTDNSFTIASEFSKVENKIKVYLNNQNLGDYQNRNKAASYAKGKYLKYLDADDIIYPHSLEIFYYIMELYPNAAAAITYNIIDDYEPYPQLIHPKQAYKKYFFDNNIFGTGPSGAIIRKDIFEQIGGFNSIRHEGDIDLWLRISAMYPVIKIQPALVWWRKHPNQENQKRKNLNLNFHTCYSALNSPTCPLDSKEIRLALDKIKNRSIRNILNMAFKKRLFKLAFTEFKKSKHNLFDIFRIVIN